jgi:hypothetical protein
LTKASRVSSARAASSRVPRRGGAGVCLACTRPAIKVDGHDGQPYRGRGKRRRRRGRAGPGKRPSCFGPIRRGVRNVARDSALLLAAVQEDQITNDACSTTRDGCDDGTCRRLREDGIGLTHALRREFPDIDVVGLTVEEQTIALFDAHVARQAVLVAEWMRVGYVQGNWNSEIGRASCRERVY